MARVTSDTKSNINIGEAGKIKRLHIADEQLRNRLLFAIPKKGRLHEPCKQLLEKCGIQYRKKNRLDIALSTSLNVALVFLPASDIGLYVSQGRVDLGITGQDVIKESSAEVHELLELGFGKCRLCVQAPIDSEVKNIYDLAGKRIVTSFPNLARKYLEEVEPNTKTKINYVSGSVEVACSLGLADAIVDLVESGDTMRAAGLELVSDIMDSQAVLVANPHAHFEGLVQTIKMRVEGVINAKKYVLVEYNIDRKNFEAAQRITPGKKSPTVAPLEEAENWVSVKAMILKSEENIILDKLHAIGADSIVIYNIQNCRSS